MCENMSMNMEKVAHIHNSTVGKNLHFIFVKEFLLYLFFPYLFSILKLVKTFNDFSWILYILFKNVFRNPNFRRFVKTRKKFVRFYGTFLFKFCPLWYSQSTRCQTYLRIFADFALGQNLQLHINSILFQAPKESIVNLPSAPHTAPSTAHTNSRIVSKMAPNVPLTPQTSPTVPTGTASISNSAVVLSGTWTWPFTA